MRQVYLAPYGTGGSVGRSCDATVAMKTLAKLALSGLLTVLPVALTVYVFWWLGSKAEAVLGGLLRRFVPGARYVPGAGLAIGFGLLIAVGLFMRATLAQRVAALFNRLLDRIPLVKTVYGSVSDLLSLFSQRTEDVEQVVLVRLKDPPLQVLGLVTRVGVPALDADAAAEDDPLAAVYIPMSYGIGGYTVLIRRSALLPVKMTVADALRFAVTAGAPSK